jgi:hypothetical protein
MRPSLSGIGLAISSKLAPPRILASASSAENDLLQLAVFQARQNARSPLFH